MRPELGFARECADDPKLMNLAHEAIESGVFRSIDLYSHQEACPPEAVQPLYRKARAAGMKLKAHVGEFGGAEEVQRTVEVLDLDEVQHGIGACGIGRCHAVAFGEPNSVECVSNEQRDAGRCIGTRLASHSHLI